jgi:hypothetical protein
LSEPRVRTTPLTCGCQASVATSVFICLFLAGTARYHIYESRMTTIAISCLNRVTVATELNQTSVYL